MGRGSGADGIFYGGEATSDQIESGEASERLLQAMAGDIFRTQQSQRAGKPVLPQIISSGEKVGLITDGEEWEMALAVVLAENDEKKMSFRADVLQWGPVDIRPSHASFHEGDNLRSAWQACRDSSQKLFSNLDQPPIYESDWADVALGISSLWSKHLG